MGDMIFYGFYGNVQLVGDLLLFQSFKSAHGKYSAALVRQLIYSLIKSDLQFVVFDSLVFNDTFRPAA